MKVIDPGHVYELQWLDGEPPMRSDWFAGIGEGNFASANRLTFVKREGEKYPGNVGSYPGTTIQEVLRALIDRIKYLDNQEHDHRNDMCILYLRHTIWSLEARAAERHGRPRPKYTGTLEHESTCPKCLHIGCQGNCHP